MHLNISVNCLCVLFWGLNSVSPWMQENLSKGAYHIEFWIVEFGEAAEQNGVRFFAAERKQRIERSLADLLICIEIGVDQG